MQMLHHARNYHHCRALLSNILHLFSLHFDRYAYVLFASHLFGYSTVHNAHSSVSSIFNPTSSSFSCKNELVLPFIQKCLGCIFHCLPLYVLVWITYVFSCLWGLFYPNDSQTLHCQRSVFL